MTNRLTVYSKPSCVQCTATFRALDNSGILYNIESVEQLPATDLEAFKARGLLQAPIVVSGDEAWAGFRPDKIAALRAAAPRS